MLLFSNTPFKSDYELIRYLSTDNDLAKSMLYKSDNLTPVPTTYYDKKRGWVTRKIPKNLNPDESKGDGRRPRRKDNQNKAPRSSGMVVKPFTIPIKFQKQVMGHLVQLTTRGNLYIDHSRIKDHQLKDLSKMMKDFSKMSEEQWNGVNWNKVLTRLHRRQRVAPKHLRMLGHKVDVINNKHLFIDNVLVQKDLVDDQGKVMKFGTTSSKKVWLKLSKKHCNSSSIFSIATRLLRQNTL